MYQALQQQVQQHIREQKRRELKEQGLLPSSDEEEEEPKPEPEEQAVDAEAQEVVPEGLDQAQLVAINPTAAAIMAAAQPQLGALAMPQPVASPSALPQPVAVPISMAGMMLPPTGQLISATPSAGSQPIAIPQAGAPVMVASQAASLASALAGQPQPIFTGTALPPGTSIMSGIGPLGRPVLVRQATPALPTAASLASLRAIHAGPALAGQPQLVAHAGLPGALPTGLSMGGVPASMLGGMAGLPGLAGTHAGLPPGVVLGPPVLLPSRLPRPM